MTIEEIVTLIQAVSDNGLTSFEYEEGDQKLVLKKKKKKNVAQQAAVTPVVISQPAAPVVSPVAVAMPQVTDLGAGARGLVLPGQGEANGAQAPEGTGEEAVDIGSDKVVVSPLVGTFYSASAPDADPFVQVGDVVKKGQVLGIIEAMKLMNEIESEYDGVVEAVLIKNEDVVEFGQPLFRIK